MSDDDERPWRWRNLREATLVFYLLPLPWQWRWRWKRVSEWLGWSVELSIGPIVIRLECDIGNCSTGDWRARFGLSELEAWNRSKR